MTETAEMIWLMTTDDSRSPYLCAYETARSEVLLVQWSEWGRFSKNFNWASVKYRCRAFWNRQVSRYDTSRKESYLQKIDQVFHSFKSPSFVWHEKYQVSCGSVILYMNFIGMGMCDGWNSCCCLDCWSFCGLLQSAIHLFHWLAFRSSSPFSVVSRIYAGVFCSSFWEEIAN